MMKFFCENNQQFLAAQKMKFYRSSRWRCSKNGDFEKNLQKTLVPKVFSCEFWEIFKNTLFTEHLRTTVSGYTLLAIYFSSVIPA